MLPNRSSLSANKSDHQAPKHEDENAASTVDWSLGIPTTNLVARELKSENLLPTESTTAPSIFTVFSSTSCVQCELKILSLNANFERFLKFSR